MTPSVTTASPSMGSGTIVIKGASCHAGGRRRQRHHLAPDPERRRRRRKRHRGARHQRQLPTSPASRSGSTPGRASSSTATTTTSSWIPSMSTTTPATGIDLAAGSDDGIIRNSTIEDNGGGGIYLNDGSGNQILNNTIQDNGTGPTRRQRHRGHRPERVDASWATPISDNYDDAIRIEGAGTGLVTINNNSIHVGQGGIDLEDDCHCDDVHISGDTAIRVQLLQRLPDRRRRVLPGRTKAATTSRPSTTTGPATRTPKTRYVPSDQNNV